MKKQSALIILSVALMAASCTVVGALHPLSQQENDFIFKKELIGTWGDPKDPSGSCKIDTVTDSGGKLYRTEIIEHKKGSGTDTGYFLARLIKLDDWYFLDYWVDVPDIIPTGEKNYSDLLISKHFFYRLSFTSPDKIEIAAPNPDELIKLIDQEKIRLHYSRLKDDDYLILDQPGELQKGLVETKKYPLLYKDKISLVRLK